MDPSIYQMLPVGYTLRPLRADDYDKGYLQVLGHLTKVGNISRQEFLKKLDYFAQHKEEYHHWVIEDTFTNRVAAAGTVFVEQKFIHGLGCVGHLEDVVVLPEYRGLLFGVILIKGLSSIARNKGAYKVLLDCIDKNVGYYNAKCGFEVQDNHMIVRYDAPMKAKL
jgi:glucosamine-phosphate N-acetyltransferase